MNKKILIPIVGIILFILFYVSSVSAQLLLNEICATNYSGIQSTTGESDDWIELHNNSASPLNIGGYGLSDDSTKRYLFTFPSYTLNAGAKVLVFANSKTNDVIVNHWEMAVNAHTAWRYVKGSATIDTNWRNLSFNQTVWSSGNGGVGFADGDDATTVTVGVSVMMVKTFTIPDTSLISKAIFMMDYDDGFVAYLNGVEIARSYLGTQGVRPLWNDVATTSHEAQGYQGLPIDSFYLSPNKFKSLLRPGPNVLAVETHNSTPTGNDLSSIPYLFFGMSTSATSFSAVPSWFVSSSQDYFSANFKLARSGDKLWVTNPGGTTVDSKAYPPMQSDNSIGRKPDGSSSWCFMSTPTPNASNNGSTCYTSYAGDPIFSKAGGYYSTTQSLTITTSTPGGSIRYTTNGNEPTSTSTLYTGTLSISSLKVIRAKVFASGYLPSNTITNSYFIGASTHLPTVAITTDSSNLWDWNTGIYVMGPNASSTSPYKGANFWMDWEKPASIEYFDRNKNLVVRFGADIKIYGNYTRGNPKKSFEIKLHDHYGMGSFTYPIIPDKPYVTDIDNIVLRNGGTGSTSKVNFRDAFMERMLKTTYSGYLATDPTVLYLNGAYWGVYHINENHDHHWMKDNFGLNKDEIDYLKEGGSSIGIQQGSDASFWALYNYATTQSPTSATYYNQIDAQLDLKNYTDYFAAETFYNNGDWMGDWTNNIQLWRPNKAGGKWKYLVYDLDFGLGFSGAVSDNRLQIARNPTAFSYSSEMFDAVLKNPTYKRYFINRYADLMNTIWLPANANSIMHSYKDTMAFDMTADKARWGGTVSQWNTYINDMMTFESGRLSVLKNQIKSMFSLQSIVTLTLNVSPANAGRIEISTITPTPYPWSGDYFNGNPVTITAIPNPGFTFDHWHSTIAMTTNNPNQSVTYNFTGNDQITAYFTGSSTPVKLCVSELNYNSNAAYDAGDWIELHNYATTSLNLSGWWISDGNDIHKYKFPTGTVIPANGYLVLTEDSAKFKSQFPTVSVLGDLGFNFSNGGDQVRIFDYNNSLYSSFYYQDLAPWPLTPDGDGYTLELTTNLANPNNASSWFAGCMGGSPGRAYTGILLSPVSITGSTSFCSGQSATLSATTALGYTYQWKNNGINIPSATDSSFVVTQSGSYSVYITSQGCGSETTPTVVTVVTQLPAPQATPATRCGSGVLTLHASSNDTIFWYDANTNGNLLGFGDSIVTPTLNASATYYARAGNACQSTSTAVNATILTQTADPVTTLNVSRCGPGPVTLTATDTAQIRWYNQSNGGGLLQTGPSFVTNTLFNDTAYYVEAGTTCPSGRIEVFVLVTTAPSVTVHDTSRCGNGTMALTGISPFPVTWYNALYGGSPIGFGSLWTTPFLSVTDTFFAETIDNGCASVRQRVIAIVNNIPASPVVTDTTICSASSLNLNASATEQVRWYTAPSGGTLLYTGSSFTTPTINGTTIYYVENGDYCSSSRVPLTVYANGNPAPPASADVTHCGPGNVTLIASSPELISWFDAPTAGNLLAATDIYITPFISTTTTYYAEAGTVCKSQNRTAVQAIISNTLPPPSASNVTNCGAGSMTLTATTPDTVYWYSVPLGGTPLSTSHTYTTPVISNTTTYYVESRNNCTSQRVAVVAQVLSPPSAPTATGNSKCGPGSLLLSAIASGQIYWYTAATGGTLLDSGATYNTPVLNSSSTYYVETRIGTCKSTRSAAVATIIQLPAAPTTANVSRCGPGTLTLIAASPEQIYWYSVPSGGTPISTGPTFLTPSISSTTTYYAEAGVTGCTSTRVPVIATINSLPPAPTATGNSNCGAGSVILTATAVGQIYWYTAATGGTLLDSGAVFNTPIISTTKTYYVETRNGTCTSARTAAVATIIALPAAPSTTNGNRCGAGTVTLTASSPEQIYWYIVPSGGIPVATGPVFSTASISSTTTYYVETGNNCRSIRIPVQAIVSFAPSAPTMTSASRCGNGTITLSGSSPQQIYWYTIPAGGIFVNAGTTYTTPSITSTTTYYAESGTPGCTSPRVPVVATVNSPPAAPTVTNGSTCLNGSVALSASGSGQLYWYANVAGGNVLDSGITYHTPSISVTTTYYVETRNGTCSSARTPVVASINSVPAAPTTTNANRCGPGTVTLTASSPYLISWYAVPSGGSPLATGPTYITPSISSTTTYYVEAGTTCKSVRIPVQAIISSSPNAPALISGSNCGPGSVLLTGSSPLQITWYNVASGGSPLGTGNSFSTPSISSTTTYYAEAGSVGCTSARVAVVAVINSIPAAPTASGNSLCGPGSLVLSATGSGQLYWYTAATGGTLLDSGTTFHTTVLNSSSTYYVETRNGTCKSVRSAAVATIIPLPAAPTTSNVSICSAGTATLTANSPEQIYWYSVSSGGVPLSTGATYTTGIISSTTTYYVEAGNICRSTRIPVVVTIGSNPNPPILTSGSHCGPGTVTLLGNSSGQINWYTVSSGGSSVGTGPTFTTTTISATTTYYAETAGSGCSSARVAVVAVINSIPAAPTTNNVSGCGAGSITLTASSPETIYWYSAPSGGILLGTGTTYTTASISTTTTYYVETGDNCRSARISVVAIITTPPNPPILTDTAICGSSSAVLLAVSSTQVNWFDVPTGGTSLFTGLNFTTPILNATTIYYVEAGIGCNSARVPVTVTITNNVAPPATADITRCGAGTVTLNASAPQQIYWYDSMTGGNQVGVGTSFTTPSLSATTTYYVTTTSGICSSARIPVQAIIGGTQVTNHVEGAICGSGNVVLSATCSQPIDSIVWYDQPGGNVIGVGQYYITPLLSSSTTYYVVASSACTGAPIPITAVVFPNPSYDMIGDTLYLQSGTSSALDAGAGYSSYNWSTNESSQSIIVSTGGWYYVTVTDVNGCPGSDSAFVDVFTGIGSVDGKNKLEVYPNPTHDHLTISIPESSSKEFLIKILSIDGKIQMQEVIKNSFTKMQNKVISLEKFAAGVYVLELMSSDYIATVKVFVQ